MKFLKAVFGILFRDLFLGIVIGVFVSIGVAAAIVWLSKMGYL